MKTIICWLFGHKKYCTDILKSGEIMAVHDSLGCKLASIHICERCGAVFSVREEKCGT